MQLFLRFYSPATIIMLEEIFHPAQKAKTLWSFCAAIPYLKLEKYLSLFYSPGMLQRRRHQQSLTIR